MKILIPENSLIWTPSGFCFPGDIQCGTEIFILNSEDKLTKHAITEELEEPEKYLTSTIFSASHTSTVIPKYLTYLEGRPVRAGLLKIGDTMPLVGQDFVLDYEAYHEKVENKFSFSRVAAKYLALSALNENRKKCEFKRPTQEEAVELLGNIKDELEPEFGGDAYYIPGIKRKPFKKYQSKNAFQKPVHKVFYDSEKFYRLRERFNLKSDQIPKSIYANGFYLFVTFLYCLLLEEGYVNHLNFSTRGLGEKKYQIFKISWQSKLRKLIQNTAIFWNKHTLSIYKTREQRAVDELKLEEEDMHKTLQTILEIKECALNCYEADIPLGSKIILDNMVIEPHELSDREKSELLNFTDEHPDIDFAQLRKKLVSGESVQPKKFGLDIGYKFGQHGATRRFLDNLPAGLRNIDLINQTSDKQKIHVVGIFDRKSLPESKRTRHGEAVQTVTGFLHDDTGEIKCQLWGDVANKIKNGDVLELANAYTKNGRLINKFGEKWKIHDGEWLISNGIMKSTDDQI